VLKADYLDSPLSLVDTIVKQIIAVDEFQNTVPLFYLGSAIRHRIETHRKVDKLKACFLRGIGVVAAMCSTMPVRFLIA
jgi:hypothetical protein